MLVNILLILKVINFLIIKKIIYFNKIIQSSLNKKFKIFKDLKHSFLKQMDESIILNISSYKF